MESERGGQPPEKPDTPAPEEPDPSQAPETPPPRRREGGREEYETEEINFLVELPEEVLAIGFRGVAVAAQLPSELGAKFLTAFHEFAESLGALFAVRALRFGSAIFDFVPDSRAADTLFESLSEMSSSSATEHAAGAFFGLVAASDDPDSLLEQARELGERPSRAYLKVLDTLAEEDVEAEVVVRGGRRTTLSRAGVLTSREVLQREREVRVEEQTVTGRLYLANANAKSFRLEPDGDKRKILGSYPSSLEPRVGELWSKRVRATLRVRVLEVERSGRERLDYELVEIEEAPGLIF